MAGSFVRATCALPVGTLLIFSALLAACDEEAPEEVTLDPALGAAEVAEADPIADVMTLDGDVRWQGAGTTLWAPARVMQRLAEGDAVQTMVDATGELRFWSDDSRVHLQSETTLRISAQPPDATRVRQLSGRMVARLEPGDPRRMEVALPPGTLVLSHGADGSQVVEAQVDVQPTRTDIEMIHGTGRFERSSGGDALTIEESAYIVLREDGEVIEEGARGEVVTLRAPAEGETIVTRSRVSFEWETTSDATSYRLEIGGAEGTEVRQVETRQTTTDIDLPSGRYSWSVRGLRDGLVLPRGDSRAVEVIRDRTPPPLTVNAPAAGARFTTETLVVRGTTEPGATLTVDGRAVSVDEEGRFTVRRPLARGLANVVIQATDAVGNRRIVSRQVMRR